MQKSDPLENKFIGNITMKWAYYFCLLPELSELNFKSEFTRNFYIHCAKVIYGLVIYVNVCQYVKLYQIFMADPLIYDEVFRNLNITLYFTNTIYRGVFLKGKLSGKIFKKIFNFEDTIYSSDDSTAQDVYEKSMILVRKVNYSYIITALIMFICYVPAPLFRDPYYINQGNETVIVPQIPVSLWVPTPIQKFYVVSYAYAGSCGGFVTIIYCITDLICYCFIIFGVCQMDLLCHYITNLNRYAAEHSAKHRSTIEDSYREMQKDNIKRHQDIIDYIIQLNDTIRNIMLANFLPSSVQMATVIYLMMKNLNAIQVFLLSQFIIFQMVRIYIYCYAADIVTRRGHEIGEVWYNLDWTEYPEDVRKNIVMCIMRPQRPLHISIGKFHDISLETFLTIVRGTYSYSLLLNTF